jgi:hypothetical protein
MKSRFDRHDGLVEADRPDFNARTQAHITIPDRQGRLIVERGPGPPSTC